MCIRDRHTSDLGKLPQKDLQDTDGSPKWRPEGAGCPPQKPKRLELLTPRPPSLIGRVAWSHCVSDMSELMMRLSAERSKFSNVTRAALSTEGELRSRCCTLGALKEARRRMRASCAPIMLNLSTALDRSPQRSVQTPSRTGPGNNGAPRRVAS